MRRAFRISYKLMIIRYAERSSIRRAAKHFSIGRKSIRNWIKAKDSFSELNDQRKRAYIVTRRNWAYLQIERDLYTFFLENRERGVSGPMLVRERLSQLPMI